MIFNYKLTKVRCSFVVKNLVIGKRHVGNVAVNGGWLCVKRGFINLNNLVVFLIVEKKEIYIRSKWDHFFKSHVFSDCVFFST